MAETREGDVMDTQTQVAQIPAQRTGDHAPRDYCAEMRSFVDRHTGTGPYTSRIAASEIVAKLHATDPDLLDGWLHAQEVHFVWQMINDRDRSARATARHGRKAGAFREAAAAHENGDSSHLRDFLNLRFTVEDGTRRTLASLTGADLLYVGDTYERRECDNRLMKEFMRALARKVGEDTVADHYTNEQLTAMFDSLS